MKTEWERCGVAGSSPRMTEQEFFTSEIKARSKCQLRDNNEIWYFSLIYVCGMIFLPLQLLLFLSPPSFSSQPLTLTCTLQDFSGRGLALRPRGRAGITFPTHAGRQINDKRQTSLRSMHICAKGMLSLLHFLIEEKINREECKNPRDLEYSPKALNSSKTYLCNHLLCAKYIHEFHILLHRIFMLV